MTKTVVFVKPRAAVRQKQSFYRNRGLRQNKNPCFYDSANCDRFPIDNLKKRTSKRAKKTVEWEKKLNLNNPFVLTCECKYK